MTWDWCIPTRLCTRLLSQSEKLPMTNSNIAMRPVSYKGLAEREGFQLPR